jgi:hypothetical protein
MGFVWEIQTDGKSPHETALSRYGNFRIPVDSLAQR